MNHAFNPSSVIAAAVASILLAACAEAPVKPSGAAEARNNLTRLQSDPKLGNLAPEAVKQADAAVRAAEEPGTDRDLGIYRVYIAERDVDIARAEAQTRYDENQRPILEAQREAARLAARTRELEVSRAQTDAARDQAAVAQAGADQARGDALAAGLIAANSQQQAADSAAQAANSAAQAAELQLQISALQARVTERGLVLTLGDVLFTTGRSDLKAGGQTHLDRLVSFLAKYPSRTVEVDGFTDSVGSEEFNQELSQRRAQAVSTYLEAQGIDAQRITTAGKGQSNPVADNASASGRQQNRRVEVVISNAKLASR